jgi:hypothetical protein
LLIENSIKTNHQMKKLSITVSILLFAFVALIANGDEGSRLYQNIQKNFKSKSAFQSTLFDLSLNAKLIDEPAEVKESVFLQVNKSELEKIHQESPMNLVLHIPSPQGNGTWILELCKTEILTSDFKIKTSDGKEYCAPKSLYYQGIFNGDPHSMVAISLFENEIVGMLSNHSGNYDLGKLDQAQNELYVLYRSNELAEKIPFNCNTDEVELPVETAAAVAADCRVVRVYIECDFDLYTKRTSSITNVNTFVTGIYNQVAAIYTNESIQTQVSEIFVWTSTDPYISQTTSGTVLSSFRTTRTTFNGNIAHLLSTRSSNMGGIAYLDVICGTSYKHAFSNIYNSYSTFPTYSWTVNVFTHEMGHNLGSNHTQWCGWTGGALDNCYTTEGGCAAGPAPTSGGTIMSYCHLIGGVGVNLSNGFGTQPGNKIRARYAAATCINSGPTLSISPATATICSGSSVSLTASGGSTYSWTPTTGLNVSNLAAVTASPLTSTTYSVSSTVNNCTATTTRLVTVLPSINRGTLAAGNQTFTGTGDPGLISFSTAPSGGAGTYTYQWYSRAGIQSVPTGSSTTNWTAISGATSNTYDPGIQTASISFAVQVNPTGTPDCGNAEWAAGIRQITVDPAATFIPGTLATGNESFCSTGGNPAIISFSINPSGATSFTYAWYYREGIQTAPSGSSTTNWTLISGATANSYDPAAGLTVSRSYACLVTPLGGTAQWATGVRQITVLGANSSGTLASGNQSFTNSGDPTTISFASAPAGGSGTYTYQWYSRSGIQAAPTGTSTTNWTAISGATNASYNPPIQTSSISYAVQVNPAGSPDCGAATWVSGVRQITISAGLSFGSLSSGNQTFCSTGGDPSPITFGNVPTGSTGFAYQWYYRNGIQSAPVGTSIANWTIISGATSSSYDPTAGLTQSRTYASLVTPTGGTATWASEVRQITVLPPFNPGTITFADENFCGTGNPSNITLSSNPEGSGAYTWRWYFKESSAEICPTGSSITNWLTNSTSANITGTTLTGDGISFDPISAGALNSGRTFAVLITPIANGSTPACGTAQWATNCRKTSVTNCVGAMVNEEPITAESPELGQNFPNPAYGETKIVYSLPEKFQGASIVIYDQFGRSLKNINIEVGSNQTVWLQTDNFNSGTYYYSLEYFGTKLASKKLVLIK